MSAEYRIDIYSPTGEKQAEVADFLRLTYTRRVNAPGVSAFTLLGDHPALASLETNSQVVVYRRNPEMGLGWTSDFWGLVRYTSRAYKYSDIVEVRAPGILTMLSWRVVAWKAGTANRSSFSNRPAETVAKTLVAYNAGPQATTANGRVRNGVITGVSVEADSGRGNALTLDCAWDNLLETLQKIARVGGGDFDLVKTGPQNWEFRWYPGQRGVDRSDSLLFALERGNMAESEYFYDRLDEKTVAIVGGRGEGSDRQVAVRTGPDWSAANDIEVFVDARNATAEAALNTAGDARLRETRAVRGFSYRVLQTPSCYYGVHYNLGDRIRAQYGEVNVVQKIAAVTVSLDRDKAETIDVETETV